MGRSTRPWDSSRTRHPSSPPEHTPTQRLPRPSPLLRLKRERGRARHATDGSLGGARARRWHPSCSWSETPAAGLRTTVVGVAPTRARGQYGPGGLERAPRGACPARDSWTSKPSSQHVRLRRSAALQTAASLRVVSRGEMVRRVCAYDAVVSLSLSGQSLGRCGLRHHPTARRV